MTKSRSSKEKYNVSLKHFVPKTNIKIYRVASVSHKSKHERFPLTKVEMERLEKKLIRANKSS